MYQKIMTVADESKHLILSTLFLNEFNIYNNYIIFNLLFDFMNLYKYPKDFLNGFLVV